MAFSLSDAIFTSSEMREVFSDQAQLRAMMQFEWALSSALEEHALAVRGSSDALKNLLDAGFFDRDQLQSEAVSSGNIAIPFLRQLTHALVATSQVAADSLHLGATSQDLLDTALVLQMRIAFKQVVARIARLDLALVGQIRFHANTILLGRTWLQPGPPTTLGLKFAGSLVALRRSLARLEFAQSQGLFLEFGGAVGTLSALGEKGAAVSQSLARKLELLEPAVPWHSQRDGVAQIAASLAILLGTLGKLAEDVALLMQAEVAEVSEAAGEGKGGSSTMPHKQNPVACAAILTAAKQAPGLASILLASMIQEHERGLGSWQAEWSTLPQLFCLADGALVHTIDLIENLVVHPDRMRLNIGAMRGLSLSESVSVALARKIGRTQANALVSIAARNALAEHLSLADVLKAMPEIKSHLAVEEIDALLMPERYLGSAERFIGNVLGDIDADS